MVIHDLRKYVSSNNNHLLNLIHFSNFNYWLWWSLVRPKNNSCRDIMQKYHPLFSITRSSYFCALVVSLYKLYDKRKDTLNLRKLVVLSQKDNGFSSSEREEIEKNYEKALAIWEKVKILRHNYFAHLSKYYDETKLYEIANIKPDDFKEMINCTMNVFNIVRLHYYGNELPLHTPEKEIENLFQQLAR